MLVDYHVHAVGHNDREHTLENLIQYLETARERNLREIGLLIMTVTCLIWTSICTQNSRNFFLI